MNKTGIFYSFNTSNSSKVALKIQEEFGKDSIDTIDAEQVTEEQFLKYDNLILSVPTWFDGEMPNYWDEFKPSLEDMDLKGKTVAIVGLGDQISYPENFGDAIGIMAQLVENAGAKVVGYSSTEGYTFERSKGVKDGNFVGLMIDVENQDNLTDTRIKNWVSEIKKDFNL